jgi:hypothetical protein
MSEQVITWSEILDSYLTLERNKIDSASAMLTCAASTIKSLKLLNKQTSEQYNPLLYFNIRETLNSRILADLLNPNYEHGQGDLFLSEFLKNIKVEYIVGEIWDIRCESDNVDIILTAHNPLRVVVVENKINGAVDQANQLYRYYRLKIAPYYEKTKANGERYRIIYLTKHAAKKCSENSITSEDGKDRVPEELIINRTFTSDIKEILENGLNRIDKDNFRLKAFIHFLIEQTTR